MILSNANPARCHKEVRRSTGHIHGDNPVLKPTGIHTATKLLPISTNREHRKLIGVKTMSSGTNFCLPFCWCPCMAINVSVQYDGGFLPDIVLLTQCYYHRGTRLNAMKRFCIFSY